MPEGDTIYRAAAALRIALIGKKMVRFEATRLEGIEPRVGQTIEEVRSRGKHLEIVWDDGVVLHTHMRMTGSWHVYHPGERWRKPPHRARVVIGVA
ncbi:MAG: DNA-formamidopyrimidine glycosylase family protein, partial [Actinomycetota bacterium]